jgi:hypothetical protein
VLLLPLPSGEVYGRSPKYHIAVVNVGELLAFVVVPITRAFLLDFFCQRTKIVVEAPEQVTLTEGVLDGAFMVRARLP